MLSLLFAFVDTAFSFEIVDVASNVASNVYDEIIEIICWVSGINIIMCIS